MGGSSLGRVLQIRSGVVVSPVVEGVQAEEVGLQESLEAELLEALAGPLEILNPSFNLSRRQSSDSFDYLRSVVCLGIRRWTHALRTSSQGGIETHAGGRGGRWRRFGA